jgi:hypothetical protein
MHIFKSAMGYSGLPFHENAMAASDVGLADATGAAVQVHCNGAPITVLPDHSPEKIEVMITAC